MRAYEAMVVTAPDLDETALQALIERLAGIVTSGGGTVDRIDPWGTRRLAYEISGHRDGHYVVICFQSEHPVVMELERVLRLTEGVLRHIVVRQDEPPATAADEGETADAGADASAEPAAADAPAEAVAEPATTDGASGAAVPAEA